MEINVEESSDNLVSLLDKIAQNNEIIIKRCGKRVARLISEERKKECFLPIQLPHVLEKVLLATI